MKRLRLFFASIVVVLAFIGLVACGSKTTTYTVNFETNGGTNVNPITDTQIQYEPLTLKDNFTFDGWYDVEDFSTDRITFPYEIKANVTFYAKWKTAQVEKETYTVTFRTNGGLPVASVKTDVIEQAPVTSLENHIFMGWYFDADFKTKVEFPYQVTKDITLYAYLKPIEQNVTYTVKFHTDGGTSVEDFVGAIIELSPVTTKENADFKGWYEEAEFKNKVEFPYEILDNCTLYAKWEPKKQTTPDDATELAEYLSKDIKSYQEVYGLEVSNDNGSVFKGSSTYTVNGKNLTRLAPNITDQGIEVDASGNVILYRDYLFYRESEEKYYAYFQDPNGTVEGKDGRFYLVTETEDPYDEYFDYTNIYELKNLNSSMFYKYDGKWYANEDYVNEAAKLILGDQDFQGVKGSSYIIRAEAFSSLVLEFDSNGNIIAITAESKLSYGEGSTSDIGVAATYYYQTYTLSFGSINSIAPITEEDVLVGGTKLPTGNYPVLDDEDPNRTFVSDGKAYTLEELKQALASLTDYKAYFTMLYNNGTVGQLSQLITVDGNVGKVESLSSGSVAYYYYDKATQATYYTVGGKLYCDKYSYKNKYSYNQYLLDAEGSVAEGYNVKLPTTDLNIDVRDFVFDAANMCFIYKGTKLTEMGKLIFGDNDYYYNPYAEVETYNYLYFYMTDGKLSRVLATSKLEYYTDVTSMSPDGVEYYVKEVIIQNYDEQTVEFPIAASELYLPGEAKSDGSITRLDAAFKAMGSNYTYRDQFAIVADDEIYGINNGTYDIYYTLPNMTRVNDSYYYYFKNGIPYAYYGSSSSEVEASNVDIDWGTPILDLLDINWFYEGKDGNYYCKAEYLSAASLVISRYSASNAFHRPQTTTRKFTVELEFLAINLYGGKISDFYYSGYLRTSDLYGSFTEIFSGKGDFLSVGSTSFTLPTGINADETVPEHVLRNQDAPKFSVTPEGILNIEASNTASSYEAYVYLNGQLVAGYPKTVTNGFDFKADISPDGLNDGLYTLQLVGKGDGVKYKDSLPSDAIDLEISKFIKLETPTNVVVDRDKKELKFDAVSGAKKYYVEVKNTSNNLTVSQGETFSNVYDLSKLTEGTFMISVYAMGDNQTYRDSDTVTIRYSVEDNLAKMLEAFEQSHKVKQSFSVKVNGNVTYNGSFEYWYDQATNKAKLVARIYPNNSSEFTYSNPERLVTIYYYVENNKPMAKVIELSNKTGKTTTSVLENVERPYKVLADTPTYKFEDKSTSYSQFEYKVPQAELENYKYVTPFAILFQTDFTDMTYFISQYSSGYYSFSFDLIGTDGTAYRIWGQEKLVTDEDLSEIVTEN